MEIKGTFIHLACYQKAADIFYWELFEDTNHIMPDIENHRTSVLWGCQEMTDSHPNMSVWSRKKAPQFPWEQMHSPIRKGSLRFPPPSPSHVTITTLMSWPNLTVLLFLLSSALWGANVPARNFYIHSIHVGIKVHPHLYKGIHLAVNAVWISQSRNKQSLLE